MSPSLVLSPAFALFSEKDAILLVLASGMVGTHPSEIEPLFNLYIDILGYTLGLSSVAAYPSRADSGCYCPFSSLDVICAEIRHTTLHIALRHHLHCFSLFFSHCLSTGTLSSFGKLPWSFNRKDIRFLDGLGCIPREAASIHRSLTFRVW
jgi:hypothetical protein